MDIFDIFTLELRTIGSQYRYSQVDLGRFLELHLAFISHFFQQ